MKPGMLSTLFHPFDAGHLDLPGKASRILFLGAEPGLRELLQGGAEVTCVNGFRPSYLQLEREGWTTVADAEGEGYDIALVLAQKHRGLNEARIAEAWQRLREGGVILVAGAKDDGIDSLRKRTAGKVALDGSLSKYHGVVFWFTRRADHPAPFADEGEPVLVEGRFRAAPGMFSHDRVDPGSRLLAESLPADLKGAAADFCAGWGYLAAELLSRCAGIKTLDLLEADHAALMAAKANLSGAAVPTDFHWIDLAGEPVTGRYDVIVMNPPFHAGRMAEPDLGAKMIAAAAKALKPRGRLFMVANRHLPYEPVLAAHLPACGEVVRDKAFKVLCGRR